MARILAEQGANRFRVQAYQHAAVVLRGLARPVSEIFAEEGMEGLEKLPRIGKALARKLHDDLGIESLEDLESAAHDGRLESVAGLGAKRLAGIRDSLAHRLGRIRKQSGPA